MENLQNKVTELEERIKKLEEQNEKLEVTAKYHQYKSEELQEKNHLLEEEKEKYPFQYRYPHPALTADCVMFSFAKKQLHLLLVERKGEPYQGYWALPGGFLRMNGDFEETIDECAQRELFEETGYETTQLLEQFHVYSQPGRDPRERVISVAYCALVKMTEVQGGDDAARAQWFPVDELPEQLAFDHAQIIEEAKEHIKEQIHFQPIGFELLPEVFTMSELQKLYETILETTFDRRNFYKKMNALGVLDIAEERPANATNRTPIKYKFNKAVYERLKEEGFKLEF